MLNITEDEIDSISLLNNPLKDPSKRSIIIIDHSRNDRSPILIGLQGFFGTNRSFMNRYFNKVDFISVLEKIAEKAENDGFIIALPDTMTSLYGNQYINSPAVGNYEDFIVSDVLEYLFKRYGKRPVGLFGKSSGGFGAYTLAVRHPDKISGFVDVAGDSGFEYCYLPDFPAAIKYFRRYGVLEWYTYVKSKMNMSPEDMKVVNVLAMSAFYSPDQEAEMGIGLPFDTRTGLLKYDVWDKWRRLDPAFNISNNIDVLKDMAVFMQVGSRDDFHIDIGMEAMHNFLEKNGIVHFFETYDETHFDLDYLYLKSLPLLIELISD
ncbi:TVG0538469 [Thermoplasma volcanium GSS1]|uniref:TVG0538469 protein n=1 Tax=Thermoplasma volcanium (strain ATCC 51530 / DSM 4299 / JCM 9571 / NBRC 15438 / GSS1) TaxID=273116 RepID=Q97BA8_THEVO|nr:alpha/beta fold hydrolase [Thermoplasma volcanium]BAB59691.1 TVG0538469 [Thermoplasma volcanium GSS1]